jgi:hypothetical protein
MPLQNDTSTFELWLTQDPVFQLSVNPPCLTQSRRKSKMILQERQNGTKGGTYITTGEANIWFQLTEFTPVIYSNRSSK